MTKSEIKSKLYDYMGEKITIKYNLGRNKYEKYNVKIKGLYNNIFLVSLIDDETQVKSFSYTDIITKTIKIDY